MAISFLVKPTYYSFI